LTYTGVDNTGIEIDLGVHSSTTFGDGLQVTGIFTANSLNVPAINIGPSAFDGTHTFSKGILIQDASSNNVASPQYAAIQIGAENTTNNQPSQLIYLLSRTRGGATSLASIQEDARGNLVLTGISGLIVGPNIPAPASLTTTAATADNVGVSGMTSSGHCSLTATNSSAATNIATTFVSAKTTNQITVNHTATAGMTYCGFSPSFTQGFSPSFTHPRTLF
jgi:hypothetical protein